MTAADELKLHLGIREWLYFETVRFIHVFNDYTVQYRRVDRLTGERQRWRPQEKQWVSSRLSMSAAYLASQYKR